MKRNIGPKTHKTHGVYKINVMEMLLYLSPTLLLKTPTCSGSLEEACSG